MRASRKLWLRLAALSAGGMFLFSSCDPTIQSTLETGIINVANSFLAALLNAIIQLAQEGAATAQVFGESLTQIVA